MLRKFALALVVVVLVIGCEKKKPTQPDTPPGTPMQSAPRISSPESREISPAILGHSYVVWFRADGTLPITWGVLDSLPPGMVFEPDDSWGSRSYARYTGTPSTIDTFAFSISATNALGADTASFTHIIKPPPPRLVIDSPIGDPYESIQIGQNVTFRWHVEWPGSAQWYSFRVVLDKGVNACDGHIERALDAGSDTCLVVQFPYSWYGYTGADWAIEATDGSDAWCVEGPRLFPQPNIPPALCDSCRVEQCQ